MELKGLRSMFAGKALVSFFLLYIQWNLINMNSRGPSKNVHIIRNFTLTVASYISVIMPGDFNVVRFNRYFTLTVFVLTRFHCTTLW